MSVVMEVLEELWSMFVGDRRLTLLVLAVVAIAAIVAVYAKAPPAMPGAVLLVGALAVLTDSVFAAARRSRR